MFYDPRKDDHGLPHNPLNALVIPRPIGWISSLSHEGVVNLAPYSFFNLLSYKPPYVMFASSEPKTRAAMPKKPASSSSTWRPTACTKLSTTHRS